MASYTRKVCQYDGNCYRKNPKHFHEYSHPLQYPDRDTDIPLVATPPNTPAATPAVVAPHAVAQVAVDANMVGRAVDPDPPLVEVHCTSAAGGKHDYPSASEKAFAFPMKRHRHEDGETHRDRLAHLTIDTAVPQPCRPSALTPSTPGAVRDEKGSTPASSFIYSRRVSAASSPLYGAIRPAPEEATTCSTSFTDEYTGSITSTAPTEIVRELSSSSSITGYQPRRTPPMALPPGRPLYGMHGHNEPIFPERPVRNSAMPGSLGGFAYSETTPLSPTAVRGGQDVAVDEEWANRRVGSPVHPNFLDVNREEGGDTTVTEGEERATSLSHGKDNRASVMSAAEAAVVARELQEGPPTEDLLAYLLLHDPIRDCVDMSANEEAESDRDADESAGTKSKAVRTAAVLTAVPTASLYSDFVYVDTFLGKAYSMPVIPMDVSVVLLAALQLSPADPLRAFPGWQLVGPFELAWRVCQEEQRRRQQVSENVADGNNHNSRSLRSRRPSRHPVAHFRSEAAMWRCARFRHDPPECQTIAVTPCGAATEERQHLCYFRDDPKEVPSMLVMGTTDAGSTFDILGTTLTAFLRATADEARRADVVTALTTALATVEAASGEGSGRAAIALGLHADGSAPSLATQRAASERQRKRRQLVNTFHGLGIRAAYDKDTELGYREPTLNHRRLRQILQSWDGDFAARLRATLQGSASSVPESDPRVTPTLLSHLNARSYWTSPSLRSPSAAATVATSALRARPFTATDWNDIHEQFRYADMANDEGDLGLGLELGMNFFALIEAPTLRPVQGGECGGRDGEQADGDKDEDDDEEESEKSKRAWLYNPVLWHAFRQLDCAYMLLNRPLYRHILRCHLPVLAGQCPPLLESEGVFSE